MDQLNNREPLHRLITTTRKMDSITLQLLMRESYETQYGIFNHDAPGLSKSRPLALVAMHPQEDPFTYSMENRYILRFRIYGIAKEYGLSLDEFFKLPFYRAEAILRTEERIAAEKSRQQDEEEARLREEQARQNAQGSLPFPQLQMPSMSQISRK